MTVGAAVLTYRPGEHDRLDWLDECLSSLTEADALVLIDNGSPRSDLDVIRAIAREHGAMFAHNAGPLHSCEHGTNLRAAALESLGVDLSVISDDDIVWRPGWRDRLEEWWRDAPADLIITGCHVEPDFSWNATYGHRTAAGMIGKLRQSTGSGTWSYRTADWRRIGPVHEWQQGWGDVPACHRLRTIGLDIAQIDLADHRGAYASTWGNRSYDFAQEVTP